MYTFEKITKVNGFDTKDSKNASQNSYAWSMAELGNYIYVGTARNLLTVAVMAWGGTNNQNTNIANQASSLDNNAEIWRYRKDSIHCTWEKVFKTSPSDNVTGFRSMVMHKCGESCALYAAGIGKQVSLFKSTDGLHWRKVNTASLEGTSSRALVSYNGRLYIATLDEAISGNTPYLYSSCDPEVEGFTSVINTKKSNFNKSKNPVGGIDDLVVFNNRLYVGIGTENGAEIWKSDDCTPRTNHWSKVADKGFGDSLNTSIMSSDVFKDYLYIAVSKKLPFALFFPLGFDLIRIDKNDNWDVIVGGDPLVPSYPSTGYRNASLSGFDSGFNSFFNVYGWQIQSFKDNLVITTCDFSRNIKTIINGLSDNESLYKDTWGCKNFDNLLNSYKRMYHLIKKYDYPIGFDIYTSKDGCHFKPVNLNGLGNPNNYGGRTLHVSCENDLYLGTANPYDGAEVWEIDYIKSSSKCKDYNSYGYYFATLKMLNKKLLEMYPDLLHALSKTFFNETK